MADDEGPRRQRADAALESALAAGAAPADPRPYFRPVLKHLRERDPEAFARAVAHFERDADPGGGGGADPWRRWLDYGLAAGRRWDRAGLVEVDGTGGPGTVDERR
jgi:hypothetical protein